MRVFLKQKLLSLGYELTKLPTLTGGGGKSWFKRWRHRFDVKYRKTVKHLKVSLEKLKNESVYM